MIAIGDKFTVTAKYAVRNNKGRLLANYLPQFEYRVTDRNIGIVTQMIADGVASPAGNGERTTPNRLAGGQVRLRGKVDTRKKKD